MKTTNVQSARDLKNIERKNITKINGVGFNENYPMLTISNKNVSYYDVDSQGDLFLNAPFEVTMNIETENTDFNRLTLKALLLSVITELKFNEPIHPNPKDIKKAYKEATQLPKNASNEKVLQALRLTYKENDLEEDFLRIIKKF